MGRFKLLSMSEPTGTYAPRKPPSAAFMREAAAQVAGRVPACDVAEVLAMLGLEES